MLHKVYLTTVNETRINSFKYQRIQFLNNLKKYLPKHTIEEVKFILFIV